METDRFPPAIPSPCAAGCCFSSFIWGAAGCTPYINTKACILCILGCLRSCADSHLHLTAWFHQLVGSSQDLLAQDTQDVLNPLFHPKGLPSAALYQGKSLTVKPLASNIYIKRANEQQ